MEESPTNVVLFRPHITPKMKSRVMLQMESRWIGQGPEVGKFEEEFSRRFCAELPTVAVNSGTSALHLAYILAGIIPGDEVIVPLFTCTATNIPVLYQGATPVFADVEVDSLNLDVAHVERLITPLTRAIVCVHYGGIPCDLKGLRAIANAAGIPIIEDAAQALGASWEGRSVGSISDFTTFSFQAIKHITTGDGGMLALRDPELVEKARRLRWFGIDRIGKQKGAWDHKVHEVGYKYQMTDIAAAMGRAALEDWEETIGLRRKLLQAYREGLAGLDGIKLLGTELSDQCNAAWICTVLVERREDLKCALRNHGIESDQVHYRNDRYEIFAKYTADYPHMDFLESRYLVLPLHNGMRVADVERVIAVIRAGW